MARPKKQERDESEMIEVGPAPGDEEIFSIIEQLPSEEKSIQIFRIHEQGRPRYLGTLAPCEFGLERLKAEWGGGRYKLSLPLGGGRVDKMIEIEGAPVYTGSAPNARYWGANAGRALDNTPLPTTTDPNVTALVQEIRELRREMVKPAVDPLMLQLIKSLMESRQSSLDDLIKYRALFQPSQSALDGSTILNALKTGIDVAGFGEGGGSKGFNWQDVIVQLSEKVLPIIAQAFTPRPVGPIPNIPPEHGAVQGILPNPENKPMSNGKEQTGFAAIAEKLRPFAPTFINAAAKGTDPNLMVDLTIDNLDEAATPVVLDWLKSETWFDDLCGLSPFIAAQSAWWREYRNNLIEALTSPAPPEND